jgi:hypothetical protein
MSAIAVDRDYTWEEQRTDLVSRCEGLDASTREGVKSAQSLAEIFASCSNMDVRTLCTRALEANKIAPFDLKGARQGRLFAEAIVETEGVPAIFGQLLRDLQAWVDAGCPGGTEILMGDG